MRKARARQRSAPYPLSHLSLPRADEPGSAQKLLLRSAGGPTPGGARGYGSRLPRMGMRFPSPPPSPSPPSTQQLPTPQTPSCRSHPFAEVGRAREGAEGYFPPSPPGPPLALRWAKVEREGDARAKQEQEQKEEEGEGKLVRPPGGEEQVPLSLPLPLPVTPPPDSTFTFPLSDSDLKPRWDLKSVPSPWIKAMRTLVPSPFLKAGRELKREDGDGDGDEEEEAEGLNEVKREEEDGVEDEPQDGEVEGEGGMPSTVPLPVVGCASLAAQPAADVPLKREEDEAMDEEGEEEELPFQPSFMRRSTSAQSTSSTSSASSAIDSLLASTTIRSSSSVGSSPGSSRSPPSRGCALLPPAPFLASAASASPSLPTCPSWYAQPGESGTPPRRRSPPPPLSLALALPSPLTTATGQMPSQKETKSEQKRLRKLERARLQALQRKEEEGDRRRALQAGWGCWPPAAAEGGAYEGYWALRGM
ncbi:hypothetical protein JCM10213_007074 [Rhodosporidiobolus nylandii]